MAGLPVCFGQAGRPNSGRAFGNNYGSLFCQAMPSVLGATDLPKPRSVAPRSQSAITVENCYSYGSWYCLIERALI
jgi:hypothetical protein